MQNTTHNAETGTAKASRLSTVTRYYVRHACKLIPSGWIKLKEFKTLEDAETYLRDCIQGNGVMALEKAEGATFQIIKSVSEREVLKTWEGMLK